MFCKALRLLQATNSSSQIPRSILPREALKDWMNLNYNAAEVMRSAMLNMAFEAETPSFA